MEADKADFTGWATKANLKCSDGRTILKDAFKHQDQAKVPLVWQHAHNEPSNVLGHALLENREEGVYCYGFFNDSDAGKNAKVAVQHGDIEALSIYANKLVEKSKQVMHGMIREVSLVIAGANPGAFIDAVRVQHADGMEEDLDDEAVIYSGEPLEFKHEDSEEETVVEPEKQKETEETVEHAAADNGKTVQDIFDTLNADQKNVVYYMIGQALSGSGSKDAAHSDIEMDQETVQHALDEMTEEQRGVAYYLVGAATAQKSEEDAAHSDSDEAKNEDEAAADADGGDETAAHADNEKGQSMTHNAFESEAGTGTINTGTSLSHADQEALFKRAHRLGSLKEALEDHALQHGIEDIETLFPDAKNVGTTPDFIARRQEWVNLVISGTKHTPFSRIKSMTADLTLEDARAKGYVKGNMKKEEFFRVAKRVTTPQTIYKKQKLDRDDILDITDFDVVAWLKGEMRLMLEEEIARAVLVGDGRDAGDDDKINEENIRPIATDNELYVTRLNIPFAEDGTDADGYIDALTLNRRYYRGSGNPTLFTSETVLARLLLIKDTVGRRIYNTPADLQAALRVSNIVTVEILDDPSNDVIGVLVNLQDYTIGADRGGDVALFDDFDIDYNQYKYLIETRMSGALVKPKAAIAVFRATGGETLVDPVAPTYDPATHTVTVTDTTGVVYKNEATGSTLTAATPVTLSEGQELTVQAQPASGYYLASNAADEFLYTYDDGRVSTF